MIMSAAIHAGSTLRLRPRRPEAEPAGFEGMARLCAHADQARALYELAGATDAARLGEANLLPGISVHELLFGVPYARTVNAAFCASPPGGSRFSGPLRGAWYAALDAATAAREAAFHKARELREIAWKKPESFAFEVWLADFDADFMDLRAAGLRARALDPLGYRYSQALARQCLEAGAAGIVYPSVRGSGGMLACFRPALIGALRPGAAVRVAFTGAFAAPEFEWLESGEKLAPGPPAV